VVGGEVAVGDPGWVVGLVEGTDVELVGFAEFDFGGTVTEGGVASPGRGAPAISPAPVADSDVARGTPGAGGSLGIGGMANSWRASRAMVAKVGADAAAP